MHLTARDAARLLGVSESTLYRWLKSGELAATRVDEQFRFNRMDLLEFAASRRLDIPAELLADEDARTSAPAPSLADAVRAGGVHRGVPGTDKAGVLRSVVERLALPRASDRDLLTRMLLAREALGSTGYGDGIAIPHPRNPIVLHVRAPSASVCYLERPVDFGAIDGKPVHTLVTLVCPSTRAHLHLLSVVAAALRDPPFLARIAERAGADALVPEVERIESAIAARRTGSGE
jgi:PTS system nitrogen regulatory IIA component